MADPFTWDTSSDKLAAMIEDKFGIDFQQSETNYYNNDFTVTQLAAVDGTRRMYSVQTFCTTPRRSPSLFLRNW